MFYRKVYCHCVLVMLCDCYLLLAAIQQNCDNIKAHYRMGVAYKSLREYSSALQSAMKGRQQASNAKKTKEV